MSSRLHLPNGAQQAATASIQYIDGHLDAPAITVNNGPLGPVISIIGGAGRLETIASRIAAGLATSDCTPEEIARRSVVLAKALAVELSNPPEPAQ